jgi:hypothetical protein
MRQTRMNFARKPLLRISNFRTTGLIGSGGAAMSFGCEKGISGSGVLRGGSG